MANVVGLLASFLVLLLAVNFVPGLHFSALWQAIGAVILGVINMLVWQQIDVPPMPLREAAKDLVQGFQLVAGLAAFDTLIGFAAGEHTVSAAFIHSGAFGGIVDAFLFACGLLVGVPTLARAVYLFYRTPGSQFGR